MTKPTVNRKRETRAETLMSRGYEVDLLQDFDYVGIGRAIEILTETKQMLDDLGAVNHILDVDYDYDNGTRLVVKYQRPETDEEMNTRIKGQEKRVKTWENTEAKERALLAKLKAKYEGEGQ